MWVSKLLNGSEYLGEESPMVTAALYGSIVYTVGREVLLLWVYLPYKFGLSMKCYSIATATVTLVCVAQC